MHPQQPQPLSPLIHCCNEPPEPVLPTVALIPSLPLMPLLQNFFQLLAPAQQQTLQAIIGSKRDEEARRRDQLLQPLVDEDPTMAKRDVLETTKVRVSDMLGERSDAVISLWNMDPTVVHSIWAGEDTRDAGEV